MKPIIILDLLGLVITIMLISNYCFSKNLNHFDFDKLNWWSAMYNKVPPAVASVGVNSKVNIYIFWDIYIFYVSIFKYPGVWNSFYGKIYTTWFDQVFQVFCLKSKY